MRKLKLVVVLLGLTVLAIVGCGSTQSDAVFTGGQEVQGFGSLEFQFIQAQGIPVPFGTQELGFEVYARPDATGALLLTTREEIRAIVVLESVSSSAQSVRVTAYGAGGIPLGDLSVPVTVVPGRRTVVDLSAESFNTIIPSKLSLMPENLWLAGDDESSFSSLVLFNNGETVSVTGLVYTDFDTDLVTVDSAGVFRSGAVEGATLVRASYTGAGVAVSDTALIVVSLFDKSFLANSQSETASYRIGLGFEVEVAAVEDYVGNEPVYYTSFTAALTAPVEGISLTSMGPGQYSLKVSETAVVGSTAEVTGSYTDDNGVMHTDILKFVVSSTPGVTPIQN